MVKSWSESLTIQKTESFEVVSGEWRINWSMIEIGPIKGAGAFQIYVHAENGKVVSVAANTLSAGSKTSDTSYFRSKGRFYLEINADSCKWKISVEDKRK